MRVGLLGRTNVGKSTLFNRLIGTHRAIVTDISGTTREMLRETADLGGVETIFIDSPGLERFEQERKYLEQIIEESDILLFMVDGKVEPSEYDAEIKTMIVTAGKRKHTILVVNKLDSKVYTNEVYSLLSEWYSRWFGEVVPLSAVQREGVEELRDLLITMAQEQGLRVKDSANTDNNCDETNKEPGDWSIPVAILGKPNAWKSTLLNTFAGERVAHVSEKAWTTLDYISQSIDYQGKAFMVYDTAGIRKKGKTAGLEKIAYSKTQTLLEYKKPVVILLIDLDDGFSKRDASLVNEIWELGLPLLIAANKIDLMTPEQREEAIKQILRRHEFLKHIPLVHISWKEAINLWWVLDTVEKLYNDRHYRIPTGKLNKVLSMARALNPPRFPKNKVCKWKYISQVDSAPPTFKLSVNNKEYANFSFMRRVENIIRAEHPFTGIPIQIKLTSKVDTNPYNT